MIHIIDDEKDILEIVSDELTENNIDHKLHSSWKTCHPQAGDTVVHDLNGVGPMPAKIEGVRYLKFTGQSV